MSQTVKVHYPDPSNYESAFLVIDTLQLGNFVTEGNDRTIKIPVTYERAQSMMVELYQIKGPNDTVHMHHSKGILTIDTNLAAEIYAALVEMIVDVELGEDLAMIEAEEYREVAYAYS